MEEAVLSWAMKGKFHCELCIKRWRQLLVSSGLEDKHILTEILWRIG